MKPTRRYIGPEDIDKTSEITFNLAELKILQGFVLDKIEQSSKEGGIVVLPHTELAEKLEYYITEHEE